MKLIVGLGNPGIKYAKTRHNIGFLFIDKYAEIKKCDCFKSKFNGEYVMFDENGEKIILFKPHTFMNLSGIAIKEISSYFHIATNDILVVYGPTNSPQKHFGLK